MQFKVDDKCLTCMPFKVNNTLQPDNDLPDFCTAHIIYWHTEFLVNSVFSVLAFRLAEALLSTFVSSKAQIWILYQKLVSFYGMFTSLAGKSLFFAVCQHGIIGIGIQTGFIFLPWVESLFF